MSSAPSSIRVFSNPFVSTKGTWIPDVKAIMQQYRADGVDLPLYYGHSDDDNATDRMPAAGWLKLQVRGDEIWATVAWTPRARREVENKGWRFVSAEFYHRKDTQGVDKIIELCAVALTHRPAERSQVPLTARKPPAGCRVCCASVAVELQPRTRVRGREASTFPMGPDDDRRALQPRTRVRGREGKYG